MGALLRRIESLPPAVSLALIVLAGALAAADMALALASYFVMPDELGYVKQAIAIGERGFPLTPGEPWYLSWAQLQPLLLAPAYALFDTPTAFDVAHVTNGVVMASVAIPAYLLARPLLPSRPWAYAVAALSVAVPWLAMAGSMMTEVVAYPVFAWAALAMQRAIARPSLGRDVAALALIGLAFFARAQFAVLGPAFLAAIVAHELGWGLRTDRRGSVAARTGRALRRAVARHPAAVLAAAAGLVGVVALGMDDLLGGYRVVGEGALLPAGTLAAGRELLAWIAVGTGVLPLAVAGAWAAVTLLRPESEAHHAFAALAVVVAAVLFVLGGSFTVQFTSGINDRYLFYVVPLLFCGMALGLVRGRPIAPALVVTGALCAWMLYASHLRPGVSLVSPSGTFQVFLDGRAYDVGRLIGNPELALPTLLGPAALLAALALAAALRWLPARQVAVATTLAVLAYGVVETGYVLDRIADTQARASQDFLENRDWVDRALPGDARAAALVGAFEDPGTTVAVWWDLVFWNRRVDRVVIAEGDSRYDQPFHTRFTFDPETGDLEGLDHRAWLVRASGDVRFGLRGARVVDARNMLELVRAPRPYRAEWAVLGAGPRGRVPAGETVRVRVYGDGRARRRTVTLALTPTQDAPGPYRFVVRGERGERRGQVAPGGTTELRERVRVPASGYADVTLAVPATPGGPEGGGGLRIASVRLGP